MLFKKDILEQIAARRVSLAFRRWQRPSVKPGVTVTTAAGVLSIDAVDKVAMRRLTEIDVKRAGYPSRAALLKELQKNPGGDVYRIAFHLKGAEPRIALKKQPAVRPAAARAATAKQDAPKAAVVKPDAHKASMAKPDAPRASVTKPETPRSAKLEAPRSPKPEGLKVGPKAELLRAALRQEALRPAVNPEALRPPVTPDLPRPAIRQEPPKQEKPAPKPEPRITKAEVKATMSALRELDAASQHGAWTITTLRLVEKYPARRPVDLAASQRRDVMLFKRDLMKLKQAGVIEMLEVGFRISPRGRAVIEALTPA